VKDIEAAIVWVRENIAEFGGDPKRITIVGHHTGATLVNLFLLSPISKGTKRRNRQIKTFPFVKLSDIKVSVPHVLIFDLENNQYLEKDLAPAKEKNLSLNKLLHRSVF
jgi:acetyl esterase/lipase